MLRELACTRLRGVLVALGLALVLGCAEARVQEAPRSRVAIARAETIMIVDAPLTPAWLYPEGRIDYNTIELLLHTAVAGAMGVETEDEAWNLLLTPGDRVGILVDVEGIQPHDPLLEALVRQIMDRGVPMRNIIIFAGEESALFRAGYDISGRAPGVQVMASDDRGYRRGLTRIVLDYTTKLVNLSRLRVHPQIGMHAALANSLAVVPYVDRERLLREPELLPEVAAKATIRRMTVLHILDALSPAFRQSESGRGYDTWSYNGVLASTDPVAVDAVARRILEQQIAREQANGGACALLEVPYIEPAAGEYRLGVADLEQIEIVRTGP
ncbi:MAG TPA: hypothetical protein DEP45_05800 [Armatimonadetes bacterium]|nr:hypothetical protein [Armatimonadota bacterium]